MTTRVSISEGEALSMRGELDQMRAQAQRPSAGVAVSQDKGGRAVVSYGHQERYNDGSGIALAPNAAVARAPDLRVVYVNGMETSRAVAERMGWPIDGETQAPSAQAHKPGSVQHGELQDTQSATQEAPKTPAEEQAGDHVAQAMEAANGALNKAYDTNGVATAEALEAAVVDGNLNPAGFASAEVKAVVDGFTAWANGQIADTGSSVALMSEVLDDKTLSEARRAVVNSDVSKLRSIAEQAQATLADLPRTDAKAFERFIDAHLSDIAFERDGRGGWLVSVEGYGMLPWASAVRMGAVKL